MSNTADKLLARTKAHTTKHHLVAVIESDPNTPGRFTVDFALKATPYEAEIAAIELLAIVQENAAVGAGCCDACSERLNRVTQALTALTAAPGVALITQELPH
ncbi:hypothetical protein NI454_09075 [Brevundimonas diminuta]|uniref:hypothetical protein n=1 Tax=Brevundimonas diminuta TaxID=293 RepID=UPI0020976053|nr:hypothetical protein [Brevundimonas diminuta]MCO8030102.1 hypothetical protein [Brevundimonas diminuta]